MMYEAVKQVVIDIFSSKTLELTTAVRTPTGPIMRQLDVRGEDVVVRRMGGDVEEYRGNDLLKAARVFISTSDEVGAPDPVEFVV